MYQQCVHRTIVIDIDLPTVHVLSRIFKGIFDAVDLVAQSVSFIECIGCRRTDDVEMLIVGSR